MKMKFSIKFFATPFSLSLCTFYCFHPTAINRIYSIKQKLLKCKMKTRNEQHKTHIITYIHIYISQCVYVYRHSQKLHLYLYFIYKTYTRNNQLANQPANQPTQHTHEREKKVRNIQICTVK